MDVNKGGKSQNKNDKKIPDDTELEKLKRNMNKLKERESANEDDFAKPVVLICTGSYNPVHLQHVNVFQIAKDHLEAKGYSVLAGFLSPSHDNYVRSKLRDDAIPVSHRIEMIRLATSQSDWIDVHTWEADQESFEDFPRVAREVKRQVEAELEKNIDVFYLCGADHFMNCRLTRGLGEIGVVAVARTGVDIQLPRESKDNVIVIQGDFASDVSSSLVRRRMREGVEEPLSDLLHPGVEDYLRKMSTELLGKSMKENEGKGKTFVNNFRKAMKF